MLEARAGKNINRNETKRETEEKNRKRERGDSVAWKTDQTRGKKEKRRWCKKKKPAVSKTKESAAGVVHEQLVPKTESRTKWVLFGLEQGQSWAGFASRERRQNQKRPTGRSLYNREGKPHKHNRDALDSLMIWLGLNLCQRGRQGDIKKKKGIYKKSRKEGKTAEWRMQSIVYALTMAAETTALFHFSPTNNMLIPTNIYYTIWKLCLLQYRWLGLKEKYYSFQFALQFLCRAKVERNVVLISSSAFPLEKKEIHILFSIKSDNPFSFFCHPSASQIKHLLFGIQHVVWNNEINMSNETTTTPLWLFLYIKTSNESLCGKKQRKWKSR